MFRIALQFLFCTAAVPLCAYALPGVYAPSSAHALIVGACLALLFLVLRPVARLLLSVLNALTIGLLGLAIDWGLVLLCAWIVPGYLALESAWWALAVAVVANLLRALAGKLAKRV